MMQIKFQLIDELIAIDERLHADFAAGKISDDFKNMARRFELHLRTYCKARKFHYFKNKAILNMWDEFVKSIADPCKPVSLYGLRVESKPECFGISEKIDKLFQLLY